MKETLTASSAFHLLIQAAADGIDSREEGEKAGIIQEWMNEDEGIAIILALLVINGYESRFSPKIMTSLLLNYCRDDLTNAFVEFTCQLSSQKGNLLLSSDLRNQQIDVRIDIRQAAVDGKTLGWQQTWGMFKEPYASQWCDSFASY